MEFSETRENWQRLADVVRKNLVRILLEGNDQEKATPTGFDDETVIRLTTLIEYKLYDLLVYLQRLEVDFVAAKH